MPGVVPVSVVAATSTTSEPVVASVTNMATHLSSLSAAQIYDMLENRDAQLRKSKCLLNALMQMCLGKRTKLKAPTPYVIWTPLKAL